MSVPQEQLDRVVAAAKAREAQGYFQKAKEGDKRACSLFARLVGFDLNPTGKTSDYGWLTKVPPESNEDGYADDALCFGADPNDLRNVVDLINGAGEPNASIPGRITPDSVKERRAHNKWERPRALTPEEMDYLNSGDAPIPQPPSIPSYEALGGDEGAKKISRVLEHDYKAAHRPGLDGECGSWLRRTDYDFLSGIVPTVEGSITKHRDEWLDGLGLITETPDGPSHERLTCVICAASVLHQLGTARPLIAHAADCMTK